jgi:hypothetical protein
MIKQTQLFLAIDDEEAFSSAVRVIRPCLAVVDDSRWSTSAPPIVPSIAACSSGFAFLWDQGIVERLPVLARDDGRFEGPQAGVVIEVSRSRRIDNLLLSGRLAVSVSTGVSGKRVAEAMEQFAADVWKVMKAVTAPVVTVDPSTGSVVRERVSEYRAGHHAVAWANTGVDHFFRDRSVQVFFKPAMQSGTGIK